MLYLSVFNDVERLLDARRMEYLSEISIDNGRDLVRIFRSKVERLLNMFRVTPNMLHTSFLQLISLYSRITKYIPENPSHVEIISFIKNLSEKYNRLSLDYHVNYMNRNISLHPWSIENFRELFILCFFQYYKNTTIKIKKPTCGTAI